MKAWHFSENAYPYLPPADEYESIRVTLPNRLYDPEKGAALYDRFLDEWLIAEDEGMEIMLNEHHQTATCLDAAAPLMAAILARQTKKARICILGNPIANRGDPIRIAEEMAVIDNVSRGRLDCGFVRGVPYEIFAANTNPTQTLDRLWEGVDLVTKAWTTHDGPFNFEGRFTHRRNVNVWPRPYQQPHPMIWITGSSDYENIKKVAGRGYVFATFLQPHDKVKLMFDAYRSAMVERGLPNGAGMAFMPLVYTADNDTEAERGAKELCWYLQAKTSPQFRNPPGYVGIDLNVKALQGAFSGRTDAVRAKGMEYLRDQGILVYGTPDSVAKQVKLLYDRVGGFDHLLMMQQAGFLDHKSVVRSMTLFAKEVYPQIKDLPRTKPAKEKAA